MAHGTPDWGVTAGAVTTYQLTDLAEAVVRLGSIVSFDRRGDVLFLDDFEAGIGKWVAVTIGSGPTVQLSTLGPRSGLYSVRVLTSAVDGEESGIERGLPLRVLSRAGFEISAVPPAAACYWLLILWVYTGTTLYDARLRFQIPAFTLEYLDENGVFQTAQTGLDVAQGGVHYSTLKLVVDPSTGKYVRAILNGEKIDLSAFTLSSAANSGTPRLFVQAFWATQENAAVAALMDDAIVTQNEPA